ncbi:Chloroplastic group IIA intron splicing facilitator CRS1, chloroplastic [Linum perenne]
MQWTFTQVIYTAKSLEAETGGILVSVEKLKKGHAILLYRGKNYRRPHKFHSENLLTKREALQRSILLQRIGVSEKFLLLLQHYFRYLSISDIVIHMNIS